MKKLLIPIIFIVLFSNVVYAIPGDWWGTVSINDLYIADGMALTVFLNDGDTPVTETVVGQLKSNYYLVHVEAEDGDMVSFKLNDIDVDQSPQLWSVGDHEFDISITFSENYSSVVSTVADETTTVDASDEVDTVLEIITDESVEGSIDIIKHYKNPTESFFGVVELGKYLQIECSSEIEEVLSSVIIRIYYSDEELGSIDEGSLKIYYYNSTNDNWVPYNPPFGGVDTVNNYVWANSTHFSYYGLAGLFSDGQFCDSNSECSSGFCVHNICRDSSTYCGDIYCDSGETCSSCSVDCGTCPPTGGGGGGGGGGTTPTKTTITEEDEEEISEEKVPTVKDIVSEEVTEDISEEEETIEEEIPAAGLTGFFLGLGINELIIATVIGLVVAVVIIYGILKVKRRRSLKS